MIYAGTLATGRSMPLLPYSLYCAFDVLVQPSFRRYYFYFLPDQAQTHLDHFNVLDEHGGEISTDEEFPHRPPL